MDGGRDYAHTQHGIIRPLLLLTAALMLIGAVFTGGIPVRPILLTASGVCILLAFVFGQLAIRDDRDRLLVCFGPLPLLRKRIPYERMIAVEKDRSSFWAGWGIHWTPRGWIWNIGGYDCVRIELEGKCTLLGTDDPDGLVEFLRARLRKR